MGIFDGLKNKVEQLGDKAREGLEGARDKAGDLLDDARDKAGDVVDDVRERLGQDEDHDGDHAPTTESEDIGPDSSSTDAVLPGYVTGEDADSADDAGSEADAGDDTIGDEIDADSDDADPDDAARATTTVTDAPDETEADLTSSAAEPPALDEGTDDAPLEPVAKDVDPYEEPLSESIGSELSDADREALAAVVDDGTDKDA